MKNPQKNFSVITSLRYLILLFLVFILFPGCEKNTEPEQLIHTSELSSQIKTAHKDFVTIVNEQMRNVAKELKVTISSSDEPVEGIEVYVKKYPPGKPKALIVNFPIEGVDNLSIQEMEKGVDLLFIFVQAMEGSELGTGFYVIRFLKDPKGRDMWIAQFKDLSGKVVLEKPAIRKENVPVHAGGKPTSKTQKGDANKEGNAYVCQVGHFSPLNIETSFIIGDGEPQITLQNEAAIKIVQAAQKYSETIANAMDKVSAIFNKTIFDELISASMNKNDFTIYTVFNGIDNFSLDDLAKGQDLFLVYLPDMKTPSLTSGFYKTRIAKESGQWNMTFYEKATNSKAEELKAKLGERVIIEPMPADTKLSKGCLSGGIIFDMTLAKTVFELSYTACKNGFALATYTFTADRIRE